MTGGGPVWQTRPVVRRPPFTLALALSFALAASACRRPAPAAPPAPEPRAAPPPAAERPASAPPPSPSQLSQVQPPPPPCARGRLPAPALAARSTEAFRRGDFPRALSCADAALELAPRDVPALHGRAAALVGLGRLDEARLAFAQALAVDPDDPETLHGAADLYAVRLGGERGALELGREYALRGARLAERARPPRRRLAGQLLVVAAMAENDLGESRRAAAHARRALRLGAPEVDARYELGVAEYELCRFRQARAALERVLKLAPRDAWVHHYLALVAEREGEPARADGLERRARSLAPGEFHAPVAMDRPTFEQAVRDAVAALPADERRALAAVPVEVADVPALEDLTAVDPPLSPSILGLFRGPSELERCLPEDGPRCRSVVLYRRNLERFARDERELREQVTVTLLHELGHLHGESDEQLRARGLE